MNSPSPVFSHLSLTPFLLLLILVRISSADDGNWLYDGCNATFSCGSIVGVGYPFRSYDAPANCGYPGFALKCQNNIPTIQIMNLTYRLLDVNSSTRTMQIAREDAVDAACPRDLVNTTLDNSLFEYSPGYVNLTFLYGCPASSTPKLKQVWGPCPSAMEGDAYWLTGSVGPFACRETITVPVSAQSESINSNNLDQVMGEGVEVRWKVDGEACSQCREPKGRFGFDNQTTCFCPHPPSVSATLAVVDAEAPSSEFSAGPGPSPNERTSSGGNIVVLVIIIAAAVLMIIIFTVVVYLIRRHHMSLIGMLGWRKKERLHDQNVKAILGHYGSLAPTQYRYSDIAKMTKSFKNKIGQGGYGTVYKGKLDNGRLVAVKVLSETKGNGEEFINEVVSISRTSHVNVVALLGFCFEKKRRALVYEFMANGSLDKFIRNDSQSTNCHLDWRTMYQIALGIARGLEYLHRGCNTRIVHFDIKPHNILLDEDFCPKISDFGLAKLYQRKESIMSMLSARGTIGYIAPELISRAFGGVSHKSDVYSYGMLVLEMSGARQNIGEVHTSEVYFPQWIYEHFEHGKELKLQRITSREDEEIARKMILVGLWCIQANPSDRPTMSKVVEMLEGSIQSLQIPPKPFLFSPTRSAPYSQDDSMSSSSTTNHVVEVPKGRLQSLPILPQPLNLPPSRLYQTS